MRFNPLTGISSILTEKVLGLGCGSAFVFQSPDGDFVYSDLAAASAYPSPGTGFNPLTGISSILTRGEGDCINVPNTCFNPLTGISSILTCSTAIAPASSGGMFQSPDGDFVYSDQTTSRSSVVNSKSFNPLTGISSILTGRLHRGVQSPGGVSIP